MASAIHSSLHTQKHYYDGSNDQKGLNLGSRLLLDSFTLAGASIPMGE